MGTAKEVTTPNQEISDLRSLSLNKLGFLVYKDWEKVKYAAKPYLQAIMQMPANGMYGLEDWQMVVLYFLNNATTWRGEIARAVKKELNWRVENNRMNGNV